MRGKIPVNKIAACAIIYSVVEPWRMFIERKTADYPVKVFANMLCLPGGNWVGEAAKADANPLATLRRELGEEFRLAVSEAKKDEMASLGFAAGADGHDLQRGTEATADDIECFETLKYAMYAAITPFIDMLITIPKAVFDSADSENKRGDTTVLASYFTIGLEKSDWDDLVRLQEKYGNLSNESETLLVTFTELVMNRNKLEVSWGHDRALYDFFIAHSHEVGCEQYYNIPLLGGIPTRALGAPLASYDEYKELYEIARQP
jgi:hypothetical protein